MKLFQILLVVAIFGLRPEIAKADHFKVYVLTGQSNSLGCTTANAADSKAAKPSGNAADSKIPFFWSNRSTRGGDGDAALIGDSDGKITTLREQQGEGRNETFWGPEIGFGRALEKSGRNDFLIIKASRGGGGNSYWLKDGQMYNHVVKTVLDCTTKLEENGDTFQIVGLLFLQGESNNAAEASAAGQRFRDLLDQFRTGFPNASRMQGYIGGIAAAGGPRDVTRDAQKALAKESDDVVYFSNLNLEDQLYDRLHFDSNAKLEIGERFAKAVEKQESGAFTKNHAQRNWTNAAGKTIPATFVKRDGNQISLKLTNGKTATVALDQLSQADQNWVAENAN